MYNKPEKFSLYWVDDNVGEDWFVLAPKYKNSPEFYGLELAEEFHSYYVELGYDLYGGGIYPDCNATFVCDIPTSILEETYVNLYDKSGERVASEGRITYLEASKQAYIELMSTLDTLDSILEHEILPVLPDHLKDLINNSDNSIDTAYDYFTENFETSSSIEVFFEDVLNVEDVDMTDIILYFLYNTRIKKNIEFFASDKPYGCVTGHPYILNKIDGMSYIDNGRVSKHKTYIYDGCVYQEGETVVKINGTKL